MTETTIGSLLNNPLVLLVVVISGLAVMGFSYYVLKQNAQTMAEVTKAIENMVTSLVSHKERQDTEKAKAQDGLLLALVRVTDIMERLLILYEQKAGQPYNKQRPSPGGD